MARYTRSRAKSGSGRSGSGRSGYSKRKPARRSAPKSASRKRSTGRVARRSVARAPQTVRIVLEHAGSQPVREGDQIGIGQKVAKAPRLKPKF